MHAFYHTWDTEIKKEHHKSRKKTIGEEEGEQEWRRKGRQEAGRIQPK